VTGIDVRRSRATGVRTAEGGRLGARRAILADVGAPQLYTGLLDAKDVPAPVRRAIERFEYGNSAFKVDFALDGPIPWLNPETGRVGTVHVAENVDALTRASTELVLRLLPREPFLVTGQYAQADATRMPEGKEVFLARHVTTPGDFERMNANLVGGALNGGTAQLYQELVFRPIPGTGRNETAIARLYLASASAYPSGGVHGACGANAARPALREYGLLRRGAALATSALSGQPR
jgi:phytoene dehydrogenase-like protein